jgi:hypothetical protein
MIWASGTRYGMMKSTRRLLWCEYYGVGSGIWGGQSPRQEARGKRQEARG